MRIESLRQNRNLYAKFVGQFAGTRIMSANAVIFVFGNSHFGGRIENIAISDSVFVLLSAFEAPTNIDSAFESFRFHMNRRCDITAFCK